MSALLFLFWSGLFLGALLTAITLWFWPIKHLFSELDKTENLLAETQAALNGAMDENRKLREKMNPNAGIRQAHPNGRWS